MEAHTEVVIWQNDKNMKRNLKKIGITLGDPAGIGPEIVLKALSGHPEIYEKALPVVFGSRAVLDAAMRNLGLQLEIKETTRLDEWPAGPQRIVLFPATEPDTLPRPGKIDPLAGRLAFSWIEAAAAAANVNKIDAVVTAPINKAALKQAGLPFRDHTEMFGRLTNSAAPMTLFVTGTLRIFFYTRHLAFKDIAAHLDKKTLVQTINRCLSHLRRLGFGQPRLAVAALNPHGGEGGLMGREEIDIIEPAVRQVKEQGAEVSGPIPADSVFHLAKEGAYDAVLSLYHDQGHIAAKTLDFHRTVSLTMGLPFLRTSVDHGTAMDIAGKNLADETNMVQAILAAAEYSW